MQFTFILCSPLAGEYIDQVIAPSIERACHKWSPLAAEWILCQLHNLNVTKSELTAALMDEIAISVVGLNNVWRLSVALDNGEVVDAWIVGESVGATPEPPSPPGATTPPPVCS